MKVCVITGASSGIGRALAVELARRGGRVVLAARRAGALAEVAEACRAAGGEAEAVPTDVTDPDQCAALVDRARAAFGGIDLLVNNAGIGMWSRFDQVTDLSIFETIMRVNYLGAVYLTWHALPVLKQRRGLICAISSLTGKTGVPTRTGYAASKHALQGFCDSLRIELRNTGVDVLVVSPGFVATDIRAKVLGGDGAPIGESPRDEGRGTMSVDECVGKIVRAIDERKRELVMTPEAKVGMAIKLVAPGLVDRMAARALNDPGK
jgi:short-subunit dehydrogenase